MMTLQPRDKKLLEALSRYGVLSTRQIQTWFFASVAHTTVMRRLRKIETEGIILRIAGLKDAMSAWCLTTKGAEKIGAGTPCRYANQNTINHEVSLSSVRIALEMIGLGEHWTSETELRQQYHWKRGNDEKVQLIPDGVFVAQREGNPEAVAVELELTPKNHARYRANFAEYARKSLPWIWYIVATEAIGNLVLDQWSGTRKYDDAPELIVSLLWQVTGKEPAKAKIWGLASKEGVPTLAEFFDLPTLLSSAAQSVLEPAQGVSRTDTPELSRDAVLDAKENQSPGSAPNSENQVPSTVDPSPPTSCVRGVDAYRQKGMEGAEPGDKKSEVA